jgi:ribosomal protein L37E
MECYHRPALLKVGDRRVPSEAIRTTLTGERIKLREELSMAKTGICAKCDEERTIVAKGMCTACNYGPNKDLTREQVLEKKAAGTIRTRKPAVKSGGAQLPPFDATQLRTCGTEVPAGQGILILLRGNDDNRLYQRIMERARKNRREPGDELLALAEASLDNGNGTEKVEIGKIRNIVERMSRYPVPNGSAKEVFVEAFNMMLIRLDEMEGK